MVRKMGLLNWLKNKSNKESLDTELQQALSLTKAGKHIEAYPIFERLYYKKRNASNTFNLFQCAVYCGKTEIENELYEKEKHTWKYLFDDLEYYSDNGRIMVFVKKIK